MRASSGGPRRGIGAAYSPTKRPLRGSTGTRSRGKIKGDSCRVSGPRRLRASFPSRRLTGALLLGGARRSGRCGRRRRGDPGPWTITVKYPERGHLTIAVRGEDVEAIASVTGARPAILPATADGSTGIDDSTSMALKPGGDGFRFTAHLDLDCFDRSPASSSTTHGADYDMTAHADRRDGARRSRGTSYVTALTGTLVEDIVVNAGGGPTTAPEQRCLRGAQAVEPVTGTADRCPPAGRYVVRSGRRGTGRGRHHRHHRPGSRCRWTTRRSAAWPRWPPGAARRCPAR